jgi:subtilisin family serine protease
MARLSALGADVPKVRVYPHLNMALGIVTREGLRDLRTDARVQAVLPAPRISLIRPSISIASKKRIGVTWGLQRLGVPDLWALGLTGRGVLVGHLDTGIDAAHPALRGAVTAFAEFDLMGRQVPGATPYDSEDHGTHTAGTIVGRPVGRSAFGVAPGATLASALVIEGGDVVARVLGGLDWAVAQGVRVISMSLGFREYTEAFLPLVQVIRARNIVPAFAVGNEFAGTSRSPGNYAEALSIGASAPNDTVADFSSSQRFSRKRDPLVPDLVAPGEDILSCMSGGRYATMSGTSMATPHIAGLAALLLEAVPGATVDQVERALFDACTLPSSMLPDRANRGIPSAVHALALLQGKPIAGGGGSKPAPVTGKKRTKAKKPSKAKARRKVRQKDRSARKAPRRA